MGNYTKTHENKKALNAHLKKIKARIAESGGEVSTKGMTITYSFPESAKPVKKAKGNPVAKKAEGGKVKSNWKEEDDAWFDEVAAKSAELKGDKRATDALAICEKEATRDNLEKLRDAIAKMPFTKSVKDKLNKHIHNILTGAYKSEYRFMFGGKRHGGGKVSAASVFFSVFSQAIAYDWN
jgi:hypothetical protein